MLSADDLGARTEWRHQYWLAIKSSRFAKCSKTGGAKFSGVPDQNRSKKLIVAATDRDVDRFVSPRCVGASKDAKRVGSVLVDLIVALDEYADFDPRT